MTNPRIKEGYGTADIHIHTSLGDGMADIPELLDYVEHKTSLNVIAITDHDDIEGSYRARELAAKGNLSFEVVVGMEITTLEGHLLALYLEQSVRSLQPLAKTIDAIRAQGGLCIVPHPMSWLTRSIGQGALDRICAAREAGVYLDGIEMVNTTIAGRLSCAKARRLNEQRFHLAETGGSDAHFLASVGRVYTLFEGCNSADLRRSLIEKITRASASVGLGLGAIGPSQIAKQLVRGLLILPVRLLHKSLAKSVRSRHHEDCTRFPL